METPRFPGVRVHPTAHLEEGVEIGPGTSIWEQVHIRHGARVGRDCIVGEKSYLAYDVVIGDRVKINAMVYICAGVTVEEMVMISAGVTFTNDRFPRSFPPSLEGLMTSEPTEETLETIVRRGVTIGANATIGPGLELGRFCMVGMGSTVTRSVPPHALVVGNPARRVAFVCACGQPLRDLPVEPERGAQARCVACSRTHRFHDGTLRAEGT